jgi:hypothetical protein
MIPGVLVELVAIPRMLSDSTAPGTAKDVHSTKHYQLKTISSIAPRTRTAGHVTHRVAVFSVRKTTPLSFLYAGGRNAAISIGSM